MKRSLLALGAALIVAALVPASSVAQEVAIGVTSSPVISPVCPTGVSQADCAIVLEQMTALETVRDGVSYPTLVHYSGELFSFTVGISAISKCATGASAAVCKKDKSTLAADEKYLNSTYGGPPSAQITVLRRVGSPSHYRWEVAAQSSRVELQHYLGRVIIYPLTQELPVVPGEAIALTVPTWAPVLSFDLSSSKFVYRQSRRSDCKSVTTSEQAQLTLGQQAEFGCKYTGTRVEYSATEIVTPAPSANFRRRPAE
jgi:hypothetical protein